MIVTVFLFASGATAGLCQQKALLTQYMFNPLIINPACAGSDEVLSVTFSQRSQWKGIEGAPSTITFAAHTLFKNRHTGLGLLLTNDKVGVHNDLGIMADYAYHLKTGSVSYVSAGIQAGIHNRRSDYASLVNPSMQDPRVANSEVAEMFLDLGAGIYFRSPRLKAGISAPQLMPENVSVNDTISLSFSRVNYFGLVQYTLNAAEHIKLRPGVLVKYYQNTPVSYDINLNAVFYDALTVGCAYRRNESIDLLVRGQVSPQLDFGYAYDHPIGNIRSMSSGSHEFMIHYLFRYVEKNTVSPR